MSELLPCPFCGGEATMSFESGDTWEVVCPNHDWGDRDGEGVRVAGDVGLYAEAESEYDYDTKEWFVTDKAKEEARQRAIQIWNTRAERTCHPFVSPDGAGWYAIGCSNCGYGFADNSPDKEYLLRISKRRDIMPRYCSGCGSKVEVVE